MLLVLPLSALDNSSTNKSLDSFEQIPAEEIRVEINRDGSIFLNGSSTDLSHLKAFFQDEPKNPNCSVLVIADDEARHEDVIRVLEICCNYKYEKVKLVYQPVTINKG